VIGTGQLRPCYIVSGTHLIENGGGNKLVREEVGVALELGLGFAQGGFSGIPGRERGFVTGFRLVALGDVKVRFNLHNQVPLLNALTFLNGEFDDFSADLRADFNLDYRLDFSIRGDEFRDVSAGDLLGLDGDDHFALAKNRKSGQAGQYETNYGKYDNFPA